MHKMIRKLRNGVRRGLRTASIEVARRRCDVDPHRDLLLFGDPRGGTTWLQEVLGHIPNTAVLWEPLHTGHVRDFDSIGFTCRAPEYRRCAYIPEDHRRPDAEELFDRVLRGKAFNWWTSFATNGAEIMKAERLLVKSCYGTALLPWLTQSFRFDHAPIYLLRHPFAVVASQLDHWNWSFDVPRYERFRSEGFGHLDEDDPLYGPHREFLSTLTTRHEMLTATWCVSNAVVLRNERNDVDWISIHYEHLMSDPSRVLGDVFSRWRLPIPDGVLDDLHKPSVSSQEPSHFDDPVSQLSKWTARLSREQITSMMAVLEYFEIDVYDTDIHPRV
jgi:hypothetical protein